MLADFPVVPGVEAIILREVALEEWMRTVVVVVASVVHEVGVDLVLGLFALMDVAIGLLEVPWLEDRVLSSRMDSSQSLFIQLDSEVSFSSRIGKGCHVGRDKSV